MRIISKAAVTEFAKQHADALGPLLHWYHVAKRSDALEPLLHWYHVAKRAAWKNLIDVRKDFPPADAVGLFTVFNIAGNKYRLIAVIKYRWQIVYIRQILTHSEYGKGKWKS